ncbi:hypothetical protein D3C72_2246720 [compost metagenome]
MVSRLASLLLRIIATPSSTVNSNQAMVQPPPMALAKVISEKISANGYSNNTIRNARIKQVSRWK